MRWKTTLAAAAFFVAAQAAAGDGGWRGCAEGLEYRLSAAEARQGSLVLLEVRAPADAPLEGRWGARPLHFWPAADGGQQALVGVDLDAAPGARSLELAAGKLRCAAPLRIVAGGYPTERLRVAQQFVTPPKEVAARIAEETRLVNEVYATVTPERLWQGFRAPVEGIGPSGNFGRRRFFNRQPRAPHSGEDFSAAAGTPVAAAGRGRVALARDLYFAGNTVILDHGLGLFTLYAHLSEISVAEGAVIEAGTVVGKVGATGRVTGAHLHWGARLVNARVNPLDLLALPPP